MSRFVKGDREVKAALRELAAYVSVPANEASRAALAPTLSLAKTLAPKRFGLLRRALKIVRRKRSSKVRPQFRVGPDVAAKGRKGARAIKYAHITEWGRAPNKSGKGGMRGTRWLTRAYEATREGAVKIFGERIGPAIEERAKKLAAKAGRR